MGRSIQELLDKMKRKDLADLGFRMGLPPPGGKAELPMWRRTAAHLLPQLDATVRECLGYQGTKRLRSCLNEAAEQCGDAEDDMLVPRTLAAHHRVQLELGVLRRLALCWQDRRGWHVNPCVSDMLRFKRGERSVLEAADDLYICVRGYLLHYGMLPVGKVQEMLLGHTDQAAETVVLSVYAKRCGLDGVVFLEREQIWLCLPELHDPTSLISEVLRPDRLMIDYAAYDEEKARRAFREGVTGDPAILARLVEAGKLSGATRAMVLTDVSIAESLYQDDDRDMAMDQLLTHIDDHRYAVGELLADRYLNTVPVWRVKGHTVLETRAEARPAKISWNAPCPCGSGRTWGKCCGKGN